MGLLGLLVNSGGNISTIQIMSFIISAVVVVFLVMPVHEFAHGYAANKLGDPTARYQGRLTLNPMAHIDYLGALMIFLIGFGWAKPVSVNARNFKNQKRDMALTALAGPLSNIFFAFISFLLTNLCKFIIYKQGLTTEFNLFSFGSMPDSFWLVVFFVVFIVLQYIVLINISLAVFNLIPIPPLDGSKVLAAFLPDRIYWKLMQYERYFSFVLIALIIVISRTGLFSSVINNVASVIDKATWWPFELMLK